GPGTVWDLPPGADVKLLEWRGAAPAVREHLELVLRALYETAETPRSAFGDNGRQLSGVALETELRPLIQKTLRKRVVWTAALRRRARLIFQIAERVGLLPEGTARALRPRVIWPPLLPQDLAREVANNVALVSAGLRSHRTAMNLLGVEAPERELAQVRADRAALVAQPPREPAPAMRAASGREGER
ncbi:MAG: phage portal protein, partial [Chloroflexi bacterium]|nr:phage portal protein [Chloroflexota bacterium]